MSLVKYDNKMNLLSFKDLNKIEANLFFSLVSLLKNKSTNDLELSFNQISKFISNNKYTIDNIAKMLDIIVSKIVKTSIRWETETKIIYFTLFQKFEINKDKQTIIVSISPDFLYILNNFKSGSFTIFELAEFSNLSSKYIQTIYRLLKQFKYTGHFFISWHKFIEILDIPNSYNIGMIDNRILKPAIKELSNIFKRLEYIKTKSKSKGCPVTHIEFFFLPETDNKDSLERANKSLDKIISNKKNIIKNSKNKVNKQKIKNFDEYLYRSIRIKNKNNDTYNTLKIMQITQDLNNIDLLLKNSDDNFLNTMSFNNSEKLKNFLEKYLI